MIKTLRLIALLAIMLFSIACEAQPTIEGAWELVYVAPTNVDDSSPNGVTNTKLLFKPDGKLISLLPDAVSTSSTPLIDYTFDGKELTIVRPNGKPVKLAISFADNETMLATPQYESQRTFKRIPNIDKKLEPKSLQLINTQTAVSTDISYDTTDYSIAPSKDRIAGVWEVIAYHKVPSQQMPPYGFFNDIWTITSKNLTISHRYPVLIDTVTSDFSEGKLISSGLALGGSVGTKINWKVSFNEWGNLVLDNEYCQIILKLITKKTDIVPVIATKVVLLTTLQ